MKLLPRENARACIQPGRDHNRKPGTGERLSLPTGVGFAVLAVHWQMKHQEARQKAVKLGNARGAMLIERPQED
jgi:hypothetical protein